MRVTRIAGEGLKSLGANKVRTSLMMAGTIVGIAALVVIMAAGEATKKKINNQVNNFGPNAMMLIAGGGKDMPPPDMFCTTLTLEDANAVRDAIDDVEIVTPIAWHFLINLRGPEGETRAVAWGVESDWHDAWKWDTCAGDEISELHVAGKDKVCVIGDTVRKDLFGDVDPEQTLGQSILVNNVSLEVIGVLKTRGTSPMGTDIDNRIVMPISTAMRRVMNVDYLGAIRVIAKDHVAKDPVLMSGLVEEIRELMVKRHNISPPEENDFRIVTASSIRTLAESMAGKFSILLISLCVVTLLVGGVVLMNILLISVAERTKEIGLRRAMGATRGDIFAQFLTESLAVTFLGMVLGSLLGWGISVLLPSVTRIMQLHGWLEKKIPTELSWQPFVLAVVFALLVGTFFGVQPARRAARLHPVDALR